MSVEEGKKGTYENRGINDTETLDALDGEVRVERALGVALLAYGDRARDMVDDEGVLADVRVDVGVGRRVRGLAKLGDDPVLPRVRGKEATAGLERLTHGVDVEAVLVTEQAGVDDRVREGIGRVQRQIATYRRP